MKLRKLISGAAALAVATTAFATTAGAHYAAVEGAQEWLDTTSNQNYLITVYNKDVVDFGIDLAALDSVTFTFSVADTEWFDGSVGGWVGSSWHNLDLYPEGSDVYAAYNWCTGGEFWGVTDPDIEIDTQSDAGKPVQTVKVGDYTYQVTDKLANPLVAGDMESVNLCRIFMSEWGNSVGADTIVTKIEFKDASGNVLLTMDGKGVADKENIATGGDAGEGEGNEGGDSNTGAGDVDGSTDGDKNSPDTGIEDVAVVAGLAIVAAGAIAISRKRK